MFSYAVSASKHTAISARDSPLRRLQQRSPKPHQHTPHFEERIGACLNWLL